MTDSIRNTVEIHLAIWNAPAGADRKQSIADLYSPDVVIAEPAAGHSGHSGMTDAISALQAQLPDTAITRTSPIQTAQDLVTYNWALGHDGQPAIATGRDVLIFDHQQITSVYVLIDGA